MAHSERRRPAVNRSKWIVWAALLFVILMGPVLLVGLGLQADSGLEWLPLVAVSGLVLALIGLPSAVPALGLAARLLISLAVAVIGAIHLGEAAMVWFSGRGFGPELYGHAEWGAIRVGLQDYLAMVLLAAGALALSFFAAFKLTGLATGGRTRTGLLILLAGLSLASVLLPHQPAWKLYRSWQDWQSAGEVAELTRAEIMPWREAGLINEPPRFKQQIHATVPAQPKNLVLVFLESFSLSMLDHPDWPGLTPNLARLQEQHGWPEPFYASGYVTIEGIANSLCGTLVPYFQGNDSLTAGAGLAPNLPCLPDVLSIAGYRQAYLGGAESRFAGKGAFLNAHGYDEVLGWGYWKSQGLKQRQNSWGLSDVELFEQATQGLKTFHAAGDPFHLTLLTIGTHLPGYRYSECEPYPGTDSPFIQAVHCTDQLLGDWLQSIETSGLLEDTVVVVTADHTLFPNPEMRALFGVEATRDRRLPFIVLNSRQWAEATPRAGQSMDLPATVLDLLEINHDATFLAGSSLLRPDPPPAYWPARYGDMHGAGLRSDNNYTTCSTDGTVNEGLVSLPLDACGKRRYLQVLAGLLARYGQGSEQLDCSAATPLELTESSQSGQVAFRLGESAVASTFSRMGRDVASDRAGIRALGFNEEGTLIASTFYPATELDRMRTIIASYPRSRWLLLADQAVQQEDSDALKSLFGAPWEGDRLVLYRQGDGIIDTQVLPPATELAYRLDSDMCATWHEGAGATRPES